MIYITGLFSLLVQFLVGSIDYKALYLPLDPKDEILRDLLVVEIVVQVIEFLFYVWLIYYFSKVSRNITPVRYLDWAITTPLMLITLSAFLKQNGTSMMRLPDFLSNYRGSILTIVLLNAAMLLFGLAGELGFMNVYLSTALGFIPFAFNSKYIKETFLPSDEDKFKNALFYWFVFFWALYGVFALMSYTIKNTGYNILDIFAKNFFGLFLAYVVYVKSMDTGIKEGI